jgi:hypothetical protein
VRPPAALDVEWNIDRIVGRIHVILEVRNVEEPILQAEV